MVASDHNADETRLAVEASIVRCGYDIGLFSKSDIERWADEQIAASVKPADALLDLSMIRETHPIDVMNLLRSLAGSVTAEQSVAAQIGIIGICYRDRRISLQAAIHGLYALTLSEEAGISDEQSATIYWLDDGYDLAVAGYHGTLDDVEAAFHAFVAPYIERHRDCHKRLFSQS